MIRKLLLALSLVLLASPALAQNTQCSDRLVGDSSNACANTRFVHSSSYPKNAINDFGANPDGTTDNAAALTKIFADTNSDEVIFPPGTYRVSCGHQWSAASNIILTGTDRSTTKIKFDAGCTWSSRAFSWVDVSGGFQGITIDLNTPTSGVFEGMVGFLSFSKDINSAIFIDSAIINGTSPSALIFGQGFSGHTLNHLQFNNNLFTFTIPDTTQNYCVLLTAGGDPTTIVNPQVNGNTCINSGNIIDGTNPQFIGNNVSAWKFGAGLQIGTASSSARGCVVSDNIFHDTTTGLDVNSTPHQGFENDCQEGLITNNQAYNLGGAGFINFADGGTYVGNLSYNNGSNPGGSNTDHAGFGLAASGSSGYNSLNVTMISNRAFDNNAGTQLYGYAELTGNSFSSNLKSNNFSGSTVGFDIRSGSSTLVDDHVSSEAALAALPPGVYTSVWLDGYYALGDGGEGLFTWNATSTATPDNGVVIQPSTAPTSGRWIRATYSTRPNIRWWGAKCDFNGSTGTDDSGVFDAAVAWAGTQNGAHIELPRNAACAIANPVIIRDNNIFFEGYSFASTRHSVGQAPADCSSSVYWTSAVNNTVMFAWTPHTGTGTRAVNGGGMKNVCLFGQNVAAFGLEVQTIRNGVFDHLYFDSFSFIALYGTVTEAIDPSEPCDTQWNSFSNIVINNINPTYAGSPTAGRGMVVDGIVDSGRGDGGCNFSENTIRNLWVNTWTADALQLSGSDNNLWFNVAAGVFAPPADTYAVDVGFGQLVAGTNGGSSSESFYRLSYSTPGMIVRGTTTCPSCAPARGIMVYALDRGNGSPSPTEETGAQVSWFDSTGQWQALTKISTAPALGTGSLPTVSSCGTSPSLIAGANNIAGFITVGSGSPTSCTVTFQALAPVNTRQPVCIATAVGGAVALGVNTTTTTFTVNAATSLPSFIAYICIGTG